MVHIRCGADHVRVRCAERLPVYAAHHLRMPCVRDCRHLRDRYLMRWDGKLFGPTNLDNRSAPLKTDPRAKTNASREAGKQAKRRATEEPPVWDSERAVAGLKQILAERYPE